MYDYPLFDGTQACLDPDPAEARGFAEAVGADTEPARALCRGCTWRPTCLAYALNHDVHGVWAGTSTGERESIRASRGIPEPSSISDELDEWVGSLRVAS